MRRSFKVQPNRPGPACSVGAGSPVLHVLFELPSVVDMKGVGMFGRRKLAKHPLRCPCCGVSLTEDTAQAGERERAVRSWLHRVMAIILFAGVVLLSTIALRIWGLDGLADTLSGLGIGLALGGIVHLRDHWKARLPA